jgi:glucan biosynthesis protein
LAYVKNFKKATLMVAGSAAQKLMMSLAKEQEVLMGIADMAVWAYTAESLVLRAQKVAAKQGADAAALPTDMMQTYLVWAADKINFAGKEALMGFAEGDELKLMLMGMKRFTKVDPFNTKEARRRVAQAMVDKGTYSF